MPQNPRARNSPENQGTHKKRRTLPRHPPDTYLAILGIGFTLQSTFFIFILKFHIQSLRLRLTSTFSPCHVTPVISQQRPSEDSPSIASSNCMNLRVFQRICMYLLVFARICAYLRVSARICTYFVRLCAFVLVSARICAYLQESLKIISKCSQKGPQNDPQNRPKTTRKSTPGGSRDGVWLCARFALFWGQF